MNLKEKLINKLFLNWKGLVTFSLLLVLEQWILQYNKISYSYLEGIFLKNRDFFTNWNLFCGHSYSECSTLELGFWKVIDFFSFLFSGSYKLGLLFFGWIVAIFFLWWIFNKVKNFITFSSSFFLLIFLILSGIFFQNTISFTIIILIAIYFGLLIWGFIISIFHLIVWWFNKVFSKNSEDSDDVDSPLTFIKNPVNSHEEKHNNDEIQKMEDLWYKQIALQLSERLKLLKANAPSEVIGIEWEWGSGKTSFISLVQFYVKQKQQIFFPKDWIWFKLDNSKLFKFEFYFKNKDLKEFIQKKFFPEHPPSFLEFNPWHFESTTNLLESFFPSLSEHIESVYHTSTGSAFLRFVQSIWIETEHEIFGVKFKWWNTPTSPWYREERDKINAILGTLDYPIIVIIDDLDRINLEQCKQIFQLIYLCADLKNVHFLVSYDSEKFNSIDIPTFNKFKNGELLSESNYRPEELQLYIEKIIHSKVSLLPVILWLKQLLKTKIRKTLKISNSQIDLLDENNIQLEIINWTIDELFYPSNFFEKYKGFLSNPRKINRITSILDKILIHEKFIHKYWILKNNSRFLLFLKISFVYVYHHPIFRDIFFELQSIDLSNKSSWIDKEYYHKQLFLKLYKRNPPEKEEIDRLKEYLSKFNQEQRLILSDIIDSDNVEKYKKGTDEDLKIIIWVLVGFYSMDDVNIEWFSWELFEDIKIDRNIQGLARILRKPNQSSIYTAKFSDTERWILSTEFITRNHGKILDNILKSFQDYIRDNENISETWIRNFYGQLFLELKASDFPFPEWQKKFIESLLGHISDNISLSVYPLISWIEKQIWKWLSQDVAQRILHEIFDNPKLFENWWIFGVSYLLRLWSWLSDSKYSNLISEDTKTWTAQFVFEIFSKYYIQPWKSFLTGNSILDRYWINFVKYQFMSEREMGNIAINEWNTKKIGEKIGEYFQSVVYADPIFSDIWKLFWYLVVMSYSYSDEFTGTNLYYSWESDWNTNPFMKEILIHFQASIETYVSSNPKEELEVNARYVGYNPKPYKISEIWEHLKKVTKLDNPLAEQIKM